MRGDVHGVMQCTLVGPVGIVNIQGLSVGIELTYLILTLLGNIPL